MQRFQRVDPRYLAPPEVPTDRYGNPIEAGPAAGTDAWARAQGYAGGMAQYNAAMAASSASNPGSAAFATAQQQAKDAEFRAANPAQFAAGSDNPLSTEFQARFPNPTLTAPPGVGPVTPGSFADLQSKGWTWDAQAGQMVAPAAGSTSTVGGSTEGSGDEMSAFKTAFQTAFGREPTPRELTNDHGELTELLDEHPGLVRLLPMHLKVGLDSKVLQDLGNEDLNPVLAEILKQNPKGLEDFPATRLAQFDAPTLKGFFDLQSQVDPENQLTGDLKAILTRVTGQPPVLGQPLPPSATTPPPSAASTVQPAAGAPALRSAVAGPWTIPRVENPALVGNPATMTPLELFLQMSGGRPGTPAPATAGQPARLSGGPVFQPGVPPISLTPGGGEGPDAPPETPPSGGGGGPVWPAIGASQETAGGRLIVIGEDAHGSPRTQFVPDPRPAAARAGAQPSVAVMIGSELIQGKTEAQIEELKAQAAAEVARATTAQQRQDALERQFQITEAARERAQAIQLGETAREFDDRMGQQKAEFGAQQAGMLGDSPSLAREQAGQQADLDNKKFLASRAMEAAQVALTMASQAETAEARKAAQAEAQRQFDIGTALKGEIERGQLALSTRAQTESETAGAAQRAAASRAAQFEMERNPASFVQKAFAARGQAVPAPQAPATLSSASPGAVAGAGGHATLLGAPDTGGSAALGGAPDTGGSSTTMQPLSAGEIQASVGPGLAKALGGDSPGQFFSEIPRLSTQRLAQLTPSERQEYSAAALASGTDPADLEAEIRKQAARGAPPPVIGVSTQVAPRARLF